MHLTTLARIALARAGVRPAPLAVGFEITHLCNLACSYCDRHTPLPNELGLPEIMQALGEFHELGMRHISLDGGEPLTHRNIDEIVLWLVERGVRVFMNSNGILVPRKIDTVRRLSRLKISLDGPPLAHDRMRGARAHERAVAGAIAAREASVPVEFTCVVGQHNADSIDELLDFVEALDFRIVFQPARNSLFLDSERDGSAFQLSREAMSRAFQRIEARKRTGSGVANRWGSLRHYRNFPEDAKVPCAAGWINVTLDPEGNLFHCGQVKRSGHANNVVRQGVRLAFERLTRSGCTQCWCARVVEENQAWGGRIDAMLPARALPIAPHPNKKRRLTLLG